jgi:CRP-like cAMP-binding protein
VAEIARLKPRVQQALAGPSYGCVGDDDTSERLEALLGAPPDIFCGLSEEERRLVLAHSKRRRFHRGQHVFVQGDRHEGVFVIDGGIVRTYYTAPNGREITLAYWRAGNVVGTPQVLSTGIHQWSGIAMAPTELLSFRSDELRSLMKGIPTLAIGMIEALEFKGKCFSIILQMLGTMNVTERIIQVLRMLQEMHGEDSAAGITIRAPFTHEALALMVGASRQWVSTELHRLQEMGVIRLEKRSLVILRPDLLRV